MESDVLDMVRRARAHGYCETANLASPGAGVVATLLPLAVEGRFLAISLGAPLDRLDSRRDLLKDILLTEVNKFSGGSAFRYQVA